VLKAIILVLKDVVTFDCARIRVERKIICFPLVAALCIEIFRIELSRFCLRSQRAHMPLEVALTQVVGHIGLLKSHSRVGLVQNYVGCDSRLCRHQIPSIIILFIGWLKIYQDLVIEAPVVKARFLVRGAIVRCGKVILGVSNSGNSELLLNHLIFFLSSHVCWTAGWNIARSHIIEHADHTQSHSRGNQASIALFGLDLFLALSFDLIRLFAALLLFFAG